MASATMPLLDDDTIEFGDEDNIPIAKGQLTHPVVTFFHLGFRGAAIIIYMFCGWFVDSFIASFIAIVLVLSMDFWTVKNITGRIMVGLRWWNYVDDDGKSHWVFESRKGQMQNRINEKESTIFWMALVGAPVIWCIFFIIALFGFKIKWLLIVIIALSLNSANLFGYIKCRVGTSESISTMTTDFLKKQVMQNAVSMMTKQSAPAANPMSIPSNTV